MAIKYQTNRNDVKVYNAQGTNIATIKTAGTLVIVSGAAVDIASRGSCYPISMPNKGYVLLGHIKTTHIPGEPPPPPPSTKPTYLTAHYADGTSERYVPE